MDLLQINFVDLSKQTSFIVVKKRTDRWTVQLCCNFLWFWSRIFYIIWHVEITYKCLVEEIFQIPQGGFQSNRKRIKWRPHIGLKKQIEESVSMFLCKNHCVSNATWGAKHPYVLKGGNFLMMVLMMFGFRFGIRSCLVWKRWNMKQITRR